MAGRSLFVLVVLGMALAGALGVGQTRHVAAETVDTALYATDDRFVIASLGINAPVNKRNVADDGIMGDPAGKDDVVLYSFPTLPVLGGLPGQGGTVVIAGHVDYRPAQAAVFWSLRQAVPGMLIDYYRGDGAVITYAVDRVQTLGAQDNVAQQLVATDPESMVLISCEGTFDPVTREYNNRTFVFAVRVS